MNNKPVKLSDEQIKDIVSLKMAIPNPYEAGVWYSTTFYNKPVDVRYTHSRGITYLKIRKNVNIVLKDTQGNIINTRTEKEYYTVNLRENTITYQGW